MAGHATGVDRRTPWRIDTPGHSGQGRVVELRPVHVLEYSESCRAVPAQSGYSVGDASAGRVRWPRTWPCGTGDCNKAEMVVRGGSALGLVAWIGGDCDIDVGCRAAENLEQHPYRDESGTAPAIVAESAHGCSVQPDQSALFVQHPEYCFGADSL